MLKQISVVFFLLFVVVVASGCDKFKSISNEEKIVTPVEKNQEQPVKESVKEDEGGRGAYNNAETQDYSIIKEKLETVITDNWVTFENTEYGYSFKYPAEFTCKTNLSTRDCTKVVCKAPENGQVVDLEKMAQNSVTCTARCEVAPGNSSCILPQITINTYPNQTALNTVDFCLKASYGNVKCKNGSNFSVSGKPAIRFGLKNIPAENAEEAISISDSIYVGGVNKNYLIRSETEETNREARRLIEGIISKIAIE